jgi:VWFA-related protein
VVVDDKAGNPVSGLERNDFTLLDDNQPAKILSFHAVDSLAEKPAELVQAILVLDAANLDFSAIGREREEVDKFLRANGGRLTLPVSIFLVSDDGVKILVQPSIDGNAVAAQLDRASSGLRSITRASGAYGAIERLELSVRSLNSLVTVVGSKPGRKLLIWARLHFLLQGRTAAFQRNRSDVSHPARGAHQSLQRLGGISRPTHVSL